MLIGVGATYFLYFLSSLVHFDPWHCITSILQYMLLLPTYTHIFMIYSFCNLHDVTWGTKGADKEEGHGGTSANVSTNSKNVQYVSVDDAELTKSWEQAKVDVIEKNRNRVENPDKRDAKTKAEDQKKQFRTVVLLSWIFSNVILVVAFTNDATLTFMFPKNSQNSVNPYLGFLFWTIAFLSLIRFIGSLSYWAKWLGRLGSSGGKRYQAAPSNIV